MNDGQPIQQQTLSWWCEVIDAADYITGFVLPASLRQEALDQLSIMNVTAATLFPDLGGLARSRGTLPVHRTKDSSARPPWETNA